MGEKENMQTDYQTLWNKCLAVIKDIVPKAAFDTWFVPIVPLSYEDKKFTIQVPNQFFYEYLEEKYVNVLKVTLYRVIGQGTILNYRIMVDKTTGGTVDYPAENASTAVNCTRNKCEDTYNTFFSGCNSRIRVPIAWHK